MHFTGCYNWGDLIVVHYQDLCANQLPLCKALSLCRLLVELEQQLISFQNVQRVERSQGLVSLDHACKVQPQQTQLGTRFSLEGQCA